METVAWLLRFWNAALAPYNFSLSNRNSAVRAKSEMLGGLRNVRDCKPAPPCRGFQNHFTIESVISAYKRSQDNATFGTFPCMTDAAGFQIARAVAFG
jgi:hypothetical protein